MTQNMYRVGDYVYFETSSSDPYQIRRIEELSKTQGGNVEAKVMCFYRRRDIPSSLVVLVDKQHQSALDDSESENETVENGPLAAMTVDGVVCESALTSDEKHQLRHRELFLSRQIESMPATHIRGKCTVTLLNETEALQAYLNKEDTFFYSLVYDPHQRTLLADKGEIKVGSRYQADITPLLKEGESDGRDSSDLETLVWTPHHGLTDRQIDQFLVISRSVGTFARALDCSSSVKQPSLHMSAAAASRDITLFHAMDTLHKLTYDMSRAVGSLIPASGPVLCRDEMEEWSASEANLFEEALEKYGKDFNDIRQDFLPWKTLKNIIEYYYMWKTTDRYVQQKRVKAVEAESKLKQVYIPNYNKPNALGVTNGKMVNGTTNDVSATGKACESCQTANSCQWYAWDLSRPQCRLCDSCWQYWKKFGGLKLPSQIVKDEERLHHTSSRMQRCTVVGCTREYKSRAQLVRHSAQAHGVALRAGSPRPIMKTRAAILVHTSLPVRVMRRLCRDLLHLRKVCRNPTWPINTGTIRQECTLRMGTRTYEEFAPLVKKGNWRRKGRVAQVSVRLGQREVPPPGWMLPMQRNSGSRLAHVAFPKPPVGPDGSLIYTPVPCVELPLVTTSSSQSLLKRRTYEETNGIDGSGLPVPKRARDSDALDTFHLNQLGVNPPPGLTVTPVGVNGGLLGIPLPPSVLVAGGGTPLPATPLMGGGVPRPPHTPGRTKIATVSRIGGRSRIISWMDAPDDVYFYSTTETKKLRKSMKNSELKRAARKPWRLMRSLPPPLPPPLFPST